MMNAVVVNGGAMLNNNGNEEGERKKKKKIEKEHEEEEESLLLVLPYLDENICTEILIRVPVESLFNSFRYVCKSWLNIITNHPSNFPLKRLRSKPPCLIIQLVKCLRYSNEILLYEDEDKEEEEEEEEEKEGDYTCTTSFIKMGKQGIEKQFDITPIFKKLRILACCNGLILVSSKFKRISTIYVVNPLTNHQVMLPPHPLGSNPRYCPWTVKFIFIPSTGEYRVVVGGFRPSNEILQLKHCIQILTLSAEECCGSSSSSNDDCDLPRREWRIIELPEQQSMRHYRKFKWIWGNRNKHITFDVDTQKFYEFPFPVYHGHQVSSGFMRMGGFLTSWVLGLLHPHDDALTLSVHVLKDFHTKEWIHQYSVRIDPDFLNPKDDSGHTPVLSSGSDEVIIFRNNIHKNLWAYNVESHQRWEVGTNLIEWDEDICFYDFHVNTNVTLESLYSN